jgi:amidase
MSEIWHLSAAEMAGRISRRELSSAEVVDAHLARIDAVNPALNAIVRILADEARTAAVLADRRLKARETVGPLHGVPFTVKESIDMAGLPTTFGVPTLAQAVAPIDAPVVERMRAAGAIPIGRTNLPTWGCAYTPSARCMVSPVIPGTPIGQPAAPAAAKLRRSPAA